jgi:hypothetical protein
MTDDKGAKISGRQRVMRPKDKTSLNIIAGDA